METETNNDISPAQNKHIMYPLKSELVEVIIERDKSLTDLSAAVKVQTSSSSSSSSSSSCESACSINFMPIPKSSSGHSAHSAASSQSGSSTTSSTAATGHQVAKKPVFILNAFVNGFVQLKLCADKIDYAYIIEIYWSNETRSFVKRTFDDFVDFHKRFSRAFSEIFSPSTRRKLNADSNSNDSKKKAAKFFNLATNSIELLPVLPGTFKKHQIISSNNNKIY